MATLCTACRAEADRWTYIKPSVARGIAQATGKPAYDTIMSQLTLIRDSCARLHGDRP